MTGVVVLNHIPQSVEYSHQQGSHKYSSKTRSTVYGHQREESRTETYLRLIYLYQQRRDEDDLPPSRPRCFTKGRDRKIRWVHVPPSITFHLPFTVNR